jgi:hypothetical protein
MVNCCFYISKTNDQFERQRLIKIIKNGSVVVWQHINLQGEYDFTDDALKNSLTFSLPKLIDLEISLNWEAILKLKGWE